MPKYVWKPRVCKEITGIFVKYCVSVKKYCEKAPAKRAAAKKTTAAKTAEVKETVYIQFAGAEYNLDDIKANAKKAWAEETGKKESDVKEIQIYVKPEEHAAYYVINGEFIEGGRKVNL